MKRAVSVINAYTMEVKANWPSVKDAAQFLGIPASTIYVSLSCRTRVYEAYFVYTNDIPKFKPKERVFNRVRNLSVCPVLEEILNK